MSDDQLRLGFIGDRSMAITDDGVWTGAGVGRIIEILQSRSSGMTVALSRSPERNSSQDHRLAVAREDIVEFPWVPSFARGFFKIRSFRRVIRDVERRSDVVIVQLPMGATWSLARPQRPRVYQVCANVLEMVATSTYFRGLKRLAAQWAATTIDRNQARLIARGDARMVAHGAELASHYGLQNGRSAISSTILDREILSVPRRRPSTAPFRVLFVGYLRHEKGLDVLVSAFRRFLSDVPDAELEIVGGSDSVDQGVEGRLAADLKDLSRCAAVRHLGHLGFGPKLFQILADADVLVVPSRSEGTPRVLIEARAFGCMVVASAVGGIPSSIDDGVDGLLVPPNDPEALCSALLRLVHDRSLRQKLIAGGVDRARRCTVEAFSDVIYEEALRLHREHSTPGSPITIRDNLAGKELSNYRATLS
jgi:glycosyltransferase involved in cell wall biosynthesis